LQTYTKIKTLGQLKAAGLPNPNLSKKNFERIWILKIKAKENGLSKEYGLWDTVIPIFERAISFRHNDQPTRSPWFKQKHGTCANDDTFADEYVPVVLGRSLMMIHCSRFTSFCERNLLKKK